MMTFLFQCLVFFAQAFFLGLVFARLLNLLFPVLTVGINQQPVHHCAFALTLDRFACKIFPTKYFGSLKDQESQTWTEYAKSWVITNFIFLFVCYILLRIQHFLPLNPQKLDAVSPDLAFNIAAGFITGTDWQSYTPETTLSTLSQCLTLTVQNFAAPALAFCSAMPLIRCLLPIDPALQKSTLEEAEKNPDQKIIKTHRLPLGNFWYDFSRFILFFLLPTSCIIAVLQIWQGTPQNFNEYTTLSTLEGLKQVIGQGPVASQIAIKMLGNNGGGFFNANSAHPFENPSAFTNWLQMLAMVVLPLGLLFYYGRLVDNKKHIQTILAVMVTLLIISLAFIVYGQTLCLEHLGLGHLRLEGTETRFDLFHNTLFADLTTSTTTGALNRSFDSLHPLASLSVMFNLALGCVGIGGLGTGISTMIAYIILTIFIAGLLIGRTPDYLGRRIQKTEIQYTVIALILTTFAILIVTAVSIFHVADLSLVNPVAHYFSTILFTVLSNTSNNGSIMGGGNYNIPFFNALLGVTILIGRFGSILPLLALAGTFCKKHLVAKSIESFPLSGFLFYLMLLTIVLLVVALTFLPALCLGPISECISLYGK
jgi:K+-transporting ATPase ATPase A chain